MPTYKKVKANHWSFTLAMIYVITKCANEIEAFEDREGVRSIMTVYQR